MTKRTEVDHDKAARIERAKGRTRGQFLSLLAKHSTEMDTFIVVANENAALVNDADVRAWLEENNYVGTVYVCRFARGKDSVRRSFTRAEQKTFHITSE